MKERNQSNPFQQEPKSDLGDSTTSTFDPFEEEKERWLAQAKTKKPASKANMRIKKGRVNDLSDLVFEETKPKPKTAMKSQAPDLTNEVSDLLNSLNNFSVEPSTSDSINISADKLLESLGLGLLADPVIEPTPEIVSKPAEVQRQESKQESKQDSEDISQAGWALLSLFGKKPPKTAAKVEKAPPPPSLSLFRQYGLKEDMNKKGISKVKKPQMKVGKHKAKLQMEDVSFVDPNFMSDHKKALFCVYDGHVDKNAALAAKKLLPKELEKQLKGKEGRCHREVLRQTFLSVDRQLAEFEFEGATATAALLWQFQDEKFLQVANVGDSTAFLCRNGKAVMISQDHKVTDLAEQQRMKDAGFSVSEGQTRINGLAVSRSLGDHFIKQNALGMIIEPYVHESIKLEPTDSFFIVASDGLWDVMSGQEAVDSIKDMDNGEKMAKRLVAGALSSPKCTDNITAIVVIL
eukprot:TRINITY_DN5001_c0_g1_i1.p1 TRINITY_DN5001_c0_g1~~TRINITY_DN5001_c0_g1_i1.p1  ORF type:complete len:463 (+),score=112.36 TRINITY_DN5001_c0_g1_i1:158-1546(+)